MMPIPDFDRARHYVLQRMQAELSPQLSFHSLAHTRDDVVPAVERLARYSGIADEALLLLRTAAWFHDLGFIEQRDEHEIISARLAATALPAFGYSAEQTLRVERIILATRLPQMPHSLLEQIMADADLDSLGRADFLQTSLALRAELAAFGTPISLPSWYERQLQFLQNHSYFTVAAAILRASGKQHNITGLTALLRAESHSQRAV